MYLYSSPSSHHIVPNVDILLGHASFARLMTWCRGCLAIVRTALLLFRVIAILYSKFLEEGPFLLSPTAPRIVFEIECSVNACGNGLNSLPHTSPLTPNPFHYCQSLYKVPWASLEAHFTQCLPGFSHPHCGFFFPSFLNIFFLVLPLFYFLLISPVPLQVFLFSYWIMIEE